MKNKIISIFFLLVLLFSLPGQAYAQTYSFTVDQETVHVYWEQDGTASIQYTYVFSNSPNADPIDFVDIGLPNSSYSISAVTAQVDGTTITDIEDSPYVDTGVALGLGPNAIPPGQTGTVTMQVSGIERVLFTDDDDEAYASAVFMPNYFGSEFVNGNTDFTVVFHMPPGVTPEEPRWHSAPSGFPEEPATGFDDQGRITYTWRNTEASASRRYEFGSSFPQTYVPAGTIRTPTVSDRANFNFDSDAFFTICCVSVFGLFFIGTAVLGARNTKKRKMKYLPPKLKIEGHGVKRGLTAVEAGILMEQPMDKIMTMILFSTIKKNATEVIKRDPLQLKNVEPLPANLRAYETEFLKAFDIKNKKSRSKALQAMMVKLIKSVGTKMKGFSHKETVKYYESIMQKAWAQVESADTPEVKSQKFDEYMGWTMLDDDFNDRTTRTFRTGPVFVPIWWHRYDPGYSSSLKGLGKATSGQSSPSGSGPSFSAPNLPGGAFAASVVTGIQGFSSDVVGNVTDFTSGITNKTNPIPKSSSGSGFKSGGGGSSCACACACAGCACACAGGGR